MSTAITAQRALEADAFYSMHDLYLMFDMSTKIVEAAWQAGVLVGTDVTGSGDAYSQRFRGSAVEAWMTNGCPTAKPKPASAKATANAHAGGKSVTTKQGEAAEAWEAGIAAKITAGATQTDAVRAMVREQPALHTALLKEANSR